MIQKAKTVFVVSLMIFIAFSFFMPAPQAEAARKPNPEPSSCASGKIMDNPEFKSDNEEPKKICLPLGNDCPKFANKTGICSDNPIVKNLNTIVDVLSGLVGVVVVGVIILGGIQYAIAGDKAEAVGAAKQRIINGLIALVAFLFIFAFLQWLIPGGVFR